MRSDLYDIDVIYQTETERAVCVRETEDSDDIWIPKSLCEVDGDQTRGATVTLIAGENILQEKGLI